ncbi:MAG: hypothetical protein AAFO29_14805 [Actinomycetota bacterium]
MRLFATATDGTTSENIDRIFDGIFGIFDNLAEVGAGWGGPWEWLFPTFVALFVVLAFFAGFQSVFSLSSDKIKPFFVFALAVIAILAFVAIRGDADQNATSNGLAVLSD